MIVFAEVGEIEVTENIYGFRLEVVEYSVHVLSRGMAVAEVGCNFCA